MDAIDDIYTATGGTSFQREVWKALARRHPRGGAISYGQQRQPRPGRLTAAAAPSAAWQPHPHRCRSIPHVIGANGTLTGFASGLPRKRWLLDRESRFARRDCLQEVPGAGSENTTSSLFRVILRISLAKLDIFTKEVDENQDW